MTHDPESRLIVTVKSEDFTRLQIAGEDIKLFDLLEHEKAVREDEKEKCIESISLATITLVENEIAETLEVELYDLTGTQYYRKKDVDNLLSSLKEEQ